MLCHSKHFDDHHFKKQIELHGGPPVNPEKSKVTEGTPESSRYSIPEEITYELNCAWKKILYERFELESYKEIQNGRSPIHCGWRSHCISQPVWQMLGFRLLFDPEL